MNYTEDNTIGEFKGGFFYAGETEQGFVYKSWDNFENHPDKICYISEYGFRDRLNLDDDEGEDLIPLLEVEAKDNEGYTRNDFIRLAKEYLEEDEITEEVIETAEELFEEVDWQSPETLIDEWEY